MLDEEELKVLDLRWQNYVRHVRRMFDVGSVPMLGSQYGTIVSIRQDPPCYRYAKEHDTHTYCLLDGGDYDMRWASRTKWDKYGLALTISPPIEQVEEDDEQYDD
jgi:hypothetical protein